MPGHVAAKNAAATVANEQKAVERTVKKSIAAMMVAEKDEPALGGFRGPEASIAWSGKPLLKKPGIARIVFTIPIP